MQKKPWNFSAGPSMLPQPVLQQAQEELLDWNGQGASVMELSHRGAPFMELARHIEADLRTLLAIPVNYRVLFTAGGATTIQALLPLNFAAPGQRADYVVSGHWSQTALKQARPYVDVQIAAQSSQFDRSPDPATWTWGADSAFVHYTANETIHGIAQREVPLLPEGAPPLITDASSNIASEPMAIERLGAIYAGAQKNLGPVGISVLIVRDDLLEREGQSRADIFRYALQAERDSMLNTPPTFNWYLLGLTVRWVLEQGGTAAFRERNERKAHTLYEVIDGSDGFYRNDVQRESRSIMNVPFFLPSEDLDALFVQESQRLGFIGLKGHKAIGGIRASIYNAMPQDGVDALAELMTDFKRRHG